MKFHNHGPGINTVEYRGYVVTTQPAPNQCARVYFNGEMVTWMRTIEEALRWIDGDMGGETD